LVYRRGDVTTFLGHANHGLSLEAGKVGYTKALEASRRVRAMRMPMLFLMLGREDRQL
jgi:hypothetical protein